MPYSDTATDHWKVHEYSELVDTFVVRDDNGYVFCSCDTKADAEMVASLLNRASVRR